MLVWVASYPRSGNTLTMLALRDAFGIGRIGTIHQDNLDLGLLRRALPPSPDVPWRPPPEFSGLGRPDLVDAIRERPEPFFIKTHSLSDSADPAPALYIVRDGRDALVSHAHFIEDRRGFDNESFDRRLERLMREGIPSRGTWSENAKAWTGRSAPTAIAHFEELVADPVEVVGSACDELGVPLGLPTGKLTAFSDARSQMPRIFRRGIVGGWRDEMPAHLEDQFWSLHGEQMTNLGYPR